MPATASRKLLYSKFALSAQVVDHLPYTHNYSYQNEYRHEERLHILDPVIDLGGAALPAATYVEDILLQRAQRNERQHYANEYT